MPGSQLLKIQGVVIKTFQFSGSMSPLPLYKFANTISKSFYEGGGLVPA